MSKFDASFQIRRNVIVYERARFNRRSQQPGETSEQFIMALYELADNCEYGEMKDEMIRDRIVVGIRDSSLSLSERYKLIAARSREESRPSAWSSAWTESSWQRQQLTSRKTAILEQGYEDELQQEAANWHYTGNNMF